MYRIFLTAIVLLTVLLSAQGQERVTPRAARGGAKQGAPWAEVPASFRNIRIPEWPLPTDLERWQKRDRAKVRATLRDCLGEMPARPDPPQVRVVSREDRGDYIQERFEFDNGADMTVPGVLLLPKHRKHSAPTIIALHGHGSSKESVCTDAGNSQLVGPLLAKRGYVVAAIDACFSGDRVGKGPAGRLDDNRAQEASLFKLYLGYRPDCCENML